MAETAVNEGMNRLARTLQGRIMDITDRPPFLDFGDIKEDLSLVTNYFPKPIPQSDYMVCRSVQLGAVDDILYKTQHTGGANSGGHSHGGGEHPHGTSGEHGGHITGDGLHGHPASEGGHTHPTGGGEMNHVHDMLIGPKTRWLMPGDKVLVAWVGDDACVIDIVYPAKRIGRDANGYDK